MARNLNLFDNFQPVDRRNFVKKMKREIYIGENRFIVRNEYEAVLNNYSRAPILRNVDIFELFLKMLDHKMKFTGWSKVEVKRMLIIILEDTEMLKYSYSNLKKIMSNAQKMWEAVLDNKFLVRKAVLLDYEDRESYVSQFYERAFDYVVFEGFREVDILFKQILVNNLRSLGLLHFKNMIDEVTQKYDDNFLM